MFVVGDVRGDGALIVGVVPRSVVESGSTGVAVAVIHAVTEVLCMALGAVGMSAPVVAAAGASQRASVVCERLADRSARYLDFAQPGELLTTNLGRLASEYLVQESIRIVIRRPYSLPGMCPGRGGRCDIRVLPAREL